MPVRCLAINSNGLFALEIFLGALQLSIGPEQCCKADLQVAEHPG